MIAEIKIDWMLEASERMVNDIHKYFQDHPEEFTSKQRVVEKTLYSAWSTHPYPNEVDLMYCRVLDMSGILQYNHILNMGYEMKHNRLQKRV